MSNNAPNDCAECARLALLDALRSAMNTVRENEPADMAAKYWEDIKYHQRHAHRHTCKGAS